MRLTFRRPFVVDCIESDCNIGEVYRETRSTITLDMTSEQAAELRNRAEFYSSEDGPDGPELAGLKKSAKAVLTLLDKAESDFLERTRIESNGATGGVADMEALAIIKPAWEPIQRSFTTADTLQVKYHPERCPKFSYFHNGVRIERSRAVELIGESI